MTILVAPTVKPDMPIREAAANLINFFILTLFCVLIEEALCVFLFVGISHIVGNIGCTGGQAGHAD